MTKEYNLEELKKNYEKLRQKHNLPNFKEMNEEFEIEKLQDTETETLSRGIRRVIIEKNTAYLRFVEIFLNPSQAPMFFLALIKSLETNDRKLLENLYLKLGKFEIESLALDTFYDEKKDADFIKRFFNEWKEVKVEIEKVMKAIRISWEKKSERKEKGYLG